MGSYSSHINALIQKPEPVTGGAAVTLLQTVASKASIKEASTMEHKALRDNTARYLRGRAEALKSATLAAVAQQLQANPFGKVIDMIESLLEKLQEDASSE